MVIKFGSNSISKPYLGSNEILKAYLGSNLVYNASTLWTPDQLGSTALKLWFDASDAATITKNASNYVSIWGDKSGNGNNGIQNNGTYQPLYDPDDKSVNFSQDFMSLSSTSIKSCIAVVRNANGCATSNSICFINGVSGSVGGFLRTNSLDYTISIDGVIGATGDASINGESLVPGNGTGTNISSANSNYVGFPTQNSPDLVYWQWTNSQSIINIATVNNDSAYRSNLDIHEFIMISSTISESDRQKLDGYLAHKWGITSKLPSNHPYKSSAPTV